MVPTLVTERLVLRAWNPADREPYAAMNADPEVMELLRGPRSREQSDASADQIEAQWRDKGWGLFALERSDSGEFIGFCGLAPATFEASFSPPIEIGWRLARPHWGQGFATEAAREVLRWTFEDLVWPEIVTYTRVENTRSIAVMERIGMRREPESDFDYPVPEGEPRMPHVFYRLTAAQWCKA